MPPLGHRFCPVAGVFLPPDEVTGPIKECARKRRSDTPPPPSPLAMAPRVEPASNAGVGVPLAVMARPQPAAGARRAAAAARRSKRCGAAATRKWLKKALKNVTLPLLLCCVVSCNTGGVAKGLNKAGEALADVSEAAGNVLSVSANITVLATQATIDAINVASSAADEFRRGVDVIDVSIKRSSCKALGTGSP